jgi:hypothetical protein
VVVVGVVVVMAVGVMVGLTLVGGADGVGANSAPPDSWAGVAVGAVIVDGGRAQPAPKTSPIAARPCVILAILCGIQTL